MKQVPGSRFLPGSGPDWVRIGWGAVLIAVSAAYLAGSYAYFRSEMSRIAGEQSQVIAAVGKLKGNQIEQWRRERMADAWVLTKDPVLVHAFSRYHRDTAAKALRRQLSESLRIRATAYGYSQAFMLTPEGRVLMSTDAKMEAIDSATRRAVALARTGTGIIMSDFFREASGTVAVDVVAQMRDEDGSLLHFLVLRNDAETHLNALIRFWPTPSRTASASLIQGLGEEIVSLTGGSGTLAEALALRLAPARSAPAIVRAAMEGHPGYAGPDETGVRVLADMRAIPGTPWFLVSRAHEKEVLADGRFRAKVTLFWVGLFLLLSVTATALILRNGSQKALLETGANFRKVLESTSMIGLLVDGLGKVTFCNDYLLQITGWNREEVIDGDWFERFMPDDEALPAHRETFRKAIETGEVPEQYKCEILTREGKRRLVSWESTLLKDPRGRITGLASLGQDITDRMLSEAIIRESEQRLQLLVEHCPGAIAMFDRNMKYLVVSPRWLQDYGLGSQDIIGRSHYEVFPDIPDRWKEIHRRCVQGAVEKCDEDPFPREHGGTEWVRWEIHPWRDATGGIGGIVMFTEVITERKHAQEALRLLNIQLEQRVLERTAQLAAKNKELETFSYSVSHDLKAPLRGIDGYSKILLDEYSERLDEEGRTFLRNIRTGTEQMQQLIEDMLAYSKLERRAIAVSRLDLRRSVEKILAEKQFEMSGIEVSVEIAPGAVTADPDGLAIALRNLIDNAIKFSRSRNPAIIAIRSRIEGGRHILSIRDNGTGFSMKHHDTIFQIFQRLHRAEEYGGTGVGLAIVKKAVERMDGRVWAESEIDRGATFNIDLPCGAPIPRSEGVATATRG